MAVIRAVTTALPEYEYSKQEILTVGSRWLPDGSHERELFERFVSSSQISHRRFALPLDKILSLGGQRERAEHFQRAGRGLLTRVVGDLLRETETAPSLAK